MKTITQSPISEQKHLFKLAIFAWIIEILAAISGFAIAFVQYDKGGIVSFIKSGAVIFVIIALLELTKIPLLNAAYRTRSFFWRCSFVFIFLFSVFITFETFFISLQNNYSATLRQPVEINENESYSLSDSYIKLGILNDQIEFNESLKVEDEESLGKLNTRIFNLENQRENEINGLNGQRKNIQDEFIKSRNFKISQLQTQYDNTTNTLKSKREYLVKLIDEQSVNYKEDLGKLQEDISRLEQVKNSNLSRIDEKYDRLLENANEEVRTREKLLEDIENQLRSNNWTTEKGPGFNLFNNTPQQNWENLVSKHKKATDDLEFFRVNKLSEIDDITSNREEEKLAEIRNTESQISALKEALPPREDSLEIKEVKEEIVSLEDQLKNISTNKLSVSRDVKPLNDKMSNLDRQIKGKNNYYQGRITGLNSQVSVVYEKRLQSLDIIKQNELEILRTKNIIAQIGGSVMVYNIALNVRAFYNRFMSREDSDKEVTESFIEKSYLDTIASFWFTTIALFSSVLGSMIFLTYLVQRYPPLSWFKPLKFIKNIFVTPFMFIGILFDRKFGVSEIIDSNKKRKNSD